MRRGDWDSEPTSKTRVGRAMLLDHRLHTVWSLSHSDIHCLARPMHWSLERSCATGRPIPICLNALESSVCVAMNRRSDKYQRTGCLPGLTKNSRPWRPKKALGSFLGPDGEKLKDIRPKTCWEASIVAGDVSGSGLTYSWTLRNLNCPGTH